MADKQTSPEIASLAAMLLGVDSILDNADFREPVKRLGLRLGASERAVNEIMLPELRTILDPFMRQVRSLAGSALSQDTGDES